MTGFPCSSWILELGWNSIEKFVWAQSSFLVSTVVDFTFLNAWVLCLSHSAFWYETMSLKSPLFFLSQREVILPPQNPPISLLPVWFFNPYLLFKSLTFVKKKKKERQNRFIMAISNYHHQYSILWATLVEMTVPVMVVWFSNLRL